MLIDQTTLLTYVYILIGFVFIPGPAILLTLSRATTSGVRVGLVTGLGLALGDFVHTILVAIGLSSVIMASPFLFTLIKSLGACYLIYLGIKIFTVKANAINSNIANVISSNIAFKQAFIIEILNPKTALFFLAFLPQFVNTENGYVHLQFIILGSLFVVAGLLSTIVVALCAGKVSSFIIKSPTIMYWQNKAVGLIYCTLGLGVAFQYM
ncbi:lysine transporter LysE [Colwellia psychrerythraea]|uniref:Lysine transporter LysE n=1 Tax=Colwellia psychrerythraea TaxID=28229 RepID=A0A1Y5E3P4_COLPS|nr:lysine transporter LysE [Colwellia psychrerythraea]